MKTSELDTKAVERDAQELVEAFRKAWDGADGGRWAAFVKANGDMPVPLSVLDGLVLQLLFSMQHKNIQRNARHDAMVARLDALERKPVLVDAGVWRPNREYLPGDTVSDKSSAWIAQLVNRGERPGTSHAWRLYVKHGRDGRDRR